RELLKSDNRPLDVRTADGDDIAIHSVGGHWIHAVPLDAGPVDLLAWGVAQTGDWGSLDHSAGAFDFEVGWQPAGVPWKPWLRAGYGRSSGDDDPADGDHGTFFQILPTARIYSFSTSYNLMNNEDGFAQLLLRPAPGLVSRTDLHVIRLAEGADLWYQGAGATLADRAVGFGFPGRPAFGEHDLFRVVETTLSYQWNPRLGVALYYAHAFGSSVVRRIFESDDADFGYVEMTLTL
ncbi:MAG: alginate export family protein, partial [Candidatus Binatia bacterium]